MPAADQAQVGAEAAVHQLAVKASTIVNQLARALQQVGADDETVKQVDEFANVANEIASAGVGNVPEEAPPASPGSDPSLSPQDDLGSAIQQFQNENVAAAQAGA